MVQRWYPKIVDLLPSDGYQAPRRVALRFHDGMNVPAYTSGGTISCNSAWFRQHLKDQARGAVVHELVHVVQKNRNAPGWLIEGSADYIRWFLYEPESNGAELNARNISKARYDASYRITGNFLNWVTQTYDKDIVRKLNASGRQGKYSEALWKEHTGKTVQMLGDEWLKIMKQKLRG